MYCYALFNNKMLGIVVFTFLVLGIKFWVLMCWAIILLLC